jgi:hypothetical protein
MVWMGCVGVDICTHPETFDPSTCGCFQPIVDRIYPRHENDRFEQIANPKDEARARRNFVSDVWASPPRVPSRVGCRNKRGYGRQPIPHALPARLPPQMSELTLLLLSEHISHGFISLSPFASSLSRFSLSPLRDTPSLPRSKNHDHKLLVQLVSTFP